jgi:hypothetical protein
VEGTVYGFRVKGVEVADGAKVTKMAEKAKVSKGVQGIQMTTRHVIWPVAENAKMAEMPNMTARHVMQGLGKVKV